MTRHVLFSFIVLLLPLRVVAQASTPGSDPHLQRAVELMRQQQFPEALTELQQAQRAHPNAAEIANLLGIAETQLSHTEDADQDYRKAIALNPKLASAHKNLGFNSLNEKNYALAESELKTALLLAPSDPFVHYYLATLYLATSRDKEAVEQFEPARELLANDDENSFLMAQACIRTGHMAEALSLIINLSAKSALTPAENYKLALLLTSKGSYPEAIARFEYGVKLEPDSWTARYDLAVAFLKAGHADKAIQLLQHLAAEQPQNASVLSSLGSAYEATDNLLQALDAYKSAVRADPDNPDRYLDYTRLLMDLDRNEEAMKVVEQGIPVTQDAYALDVRLGVLRVKQGRFDEARSALQQAIDLHPDIVVAYVATAQSYMEQGEDDKALALLLKARAKLPPDAALEYYVGLVSLRLGHDDEAEAALKSSLSLRPDVSETHYQIGKLYFEKTHLEDARVEFERAMVLAPESSNAYYQLSKIYARLGDPQKAAQMAAEAKQLMQTQREDALHLQKDRLSQFRAPTPEK